MSILESDTLLREALSGNNRSETEAVFCETFPQEDNGTVDCQYLHLQCSITAINSLLTAMIVQQSMVVNTRVGRVEGLGLGLKVQGTYGSTCACNAFFIGM